MGPAGATAPREKRGGTTCLSQPTINLEQEGTESRLVVTWHVFIAVRCHNWPMVNSDAHRITPRCDKL